MANSVCEVLITTKRLEAPSSEFDAGAGALVEFWGVVRGLEDGRAIDGIEYESNTEMAEHQLKNIAQRALYDFEMNVVVVHHRIGFVRAGEPSLFVRAGTRHRGEAFQACQWIVQELKQRVPIWKRPVFRIDNRSDEKATAAATSNTTRAGI